MKSNDFLLEIFTEELPPKNLLTLMNALHQNILAGLNKTDLTYGHIKPYATPRRLAILVKDLSSDQPARTVKKFGPSLSLAFDAAGKPTQAALGFAKSCNVDITDLTKENDKLLYEKMVDGEKAVDLLPELVRTAIKKLPIAKLMRWGNSDIEFVRPVHSVILMYGSSVIDTEILGKKTGNQTFGHRTHYPKTLTINHPKNYEKILRDKGWVIADFEQRKQIIQEQAIALAKQADGMALIDENLLNEVTSIVEFPVSILAGFLPRYLQIPKECLISSMQNHQKCFPIVTAKQELLPLFVAVSNLQSKHPQEVVKGNERVMNARLADAEFFYQQDSQTSLDDYLAKLSHVVFQAQLGTLAEQTTRIEQLSSYLAKQLGVDQTNAIAAARTAKADLMSSMVGEFPELQGIMGYYYAKQQGKTEEICLALKEQYLPIHAEDKIPSNDIGQILSLANRIDTLIGMFGIDKKPTGDKDPFALRRAALGIIRIIIDMELTLDLNEVFTAAQSFYGKKLTNLNVVTETLEFILQRVKFWAIEKGFTTEEFNAVNAKQLFDIHDFYLRMEAVRSFSRISHTSNLVKTHAEALTAANKRVKNLITQLQEQNPIQLEKALQQTHDMGIIIELLTAPAERELAQLIVDKEAFSHDLLKEKNYIDLFSQLATLRNATDNFFDQVMIMVEDEAVRQNRLVILIKLRNLFLQVADISLL